MAKTRAEVAEAPHCGFVQFTPCFVVPSASSANVHLGSGIISRPLANYGYLAGLLRQASHVFRMRCSQARHRFCQMSHTYLTAR